MKKIVSLIFASLMILVSCEDDLDINTDPNSPPNINKGLALTAAEGSIATVLGGDWFNLGGMWAQFYTQSPGAGQYNEIDQYNITTDYADRLWSELYAGALNDLEYVKDESLASDDTGTFLIATVLQAFTFQYLVDIFGDVPYTEALQGSDNFSAAVTPGEEIYTDLIAKINDALAAYEENPVDGEVGAQDLIYNGDMQNWVQFANTLKLRLYLRMASTSQADAAAVTALLNEDNFLTENAAFAAFADASDKRNPFYEVQIQYLGNVNTVASNSLLEFYRRNNDPRIAEVYNLDDTGIYEGLDQGAGLDINGQLANNYSKPDIEPTHPVFFLTVPESKFLQAEAYLRYGSEALAEEKYNEGVAASFELYETLGDDNALGDPSTFTEPDGAYDYNVSEEFEDNLETIIVQKWAAMANINNIEAWIETQRTGYPIITDSEDPLYEEGRRIVSLGSILPGNQMPQSLFYPANEIQRNINIDQKDNLLQPIWWNQN